MVGFLPNLDQSDSSFHFWTCAWEMEDWKLLNCPVSGRSQEINQSQRLIFWVTPILFLCVISSSNFEKSSILPIKLPLVVVGYDCSYLKHTLNNLKLNTWYSSKSDPSGIFCLKGTLPYTCCSSRHLNIFILYIIVNTSGSHLESISSESSFP